MRMATYLYCVRADASLAPGSLEGIDASLVRDVAAGGLFAWVSDVDTTVAPTVDRLKAHDVVCAVALQVGDTPLPIRFGQTFADDAAAIQAIASREAALRARLTRVSGCVELRVVVTSGRHTDVNDDPTETKGVDALDDASKGVDDPARPGTAFLRRLAREGRADLAREVGCEEIRHAVRTRAQAFVVDQQRCESARGLSFFPVLVRRANVEAFRAAVSETLSPQSIDLSVLGPFAPYSFAGDA